MLSNEIPCDMIVEVLSVGKDTLASKLSLRLLHRFTANFHNTNVMPVVKSAATALEATMLRTCRFGLFVKISESSLLADDQAERSRTGHR